MSDLPYPEYRSVTVASIRALTDEAINAADAAINLAVDLDEAGPRTYENTLQPLEDAAAIISDAYGKGAFMGRVHPDATIRTVAIAEEERITKWGTDLIFRRDLYSAIAAYEATADAQELDGQHRRLLDHWMRDLLRAGHDLEPDDRAELRSLRARLVEVEVAFGRNLDEWDDGLDLTREQLDGLPDDFVSGLRPGAVPGTHRVSMEYPEYMPFMQQARNRELRRGMQEKFWNRAAAKNRPLLEEGVRLRHRVAGLLGRPSWAHLAMDVKMARTPEAVGALYDSIVPALEVKAQRELAAMTERFNVDHPNEELQSWDWSFYHYGQKREQYGVDANVVAEYFALDGVVAGMFELTGAVFGLEVRRVPDGGAWHPDVTLYEIRDTGADEPRAYFFADLYPREGKYGHAAAFPLVYGRALPDGTYRKPVAAIVANLTKPTDTRPSLLRHNEALTLFHEFGHILHFCLSTVPLVRFSGFDTEWDFVEAPSQIMEHWMWNTEVLKHLARHHETGAPIPVDLVERLVAARDLNIALHTLRQVFLGQVDLMLHGEETTIDLDEITRTAYQVTQLPYPEGTSFLASFGHVMGGYDAGYYGYLWAQIYGDDMFSAFEAEGVLSPTVGARYRREVLEQGGSRDAIEHLRAFLGREPTSDAFLRRIGIDSEVVGPR